MNVLAYKTGQGDFGGGPVPLCGDGNTTVPLRQGEIAWERTLGFTDPGNLRDQLRGITTGQAGTGGSGTGTPVNTLGILCHGLPGRLAMVPSGTLNTSTISTYGPTLAEINQLLARSRSRRSMVIFLACAAAAPPEGTELFALISGWMENTRIIGFKTLLTTDGMNERFMDQNMVCLPPDLRVTNEAARTAEDIRSQAGNWSAEDVRGFPSASPRAHHAREWLNGRLVWESSESDVTPRHRRHTRPAQSHQGRGTTARTRIR